MIIQECLTNTTSYSYFLTGVDCCHLPHTCVSTSNVTYVTMTLCQLNNVVVFYHRQTFNSMTMSNGCLQREVWSLYYGRKTFGWSSVASQRPT